MAHHIDKLWRSYREVIPADAGHTQVLETKRAFYAGVKSMWDAVMGPLLDEGDEPTAADMQRMAEIQEELEAFGRSGGLI